MNPNYKNTFCLVFVLSLTLIGCGGPSYRYDPNSGLCKNKKGQVGFNKDSIEECGFVSGKISSKYSNFKASKGENLRGLKVENSSLANADFSGADLTGALFVSSGKKDNALKLNNAKFYNANLTSTEIDIHYKDMAPIGNLRGATVTEQTVFPSLYFDYVGPNSSFDYGLSLLEGIANFSFSNSEGDLSQGAVFSESIPHPQLNLAHSDFGRLKNGLYSTTGDPEIFGGTSSTDAFHFVNSRVGFWSSSYLSPGVIAFNITTSLFLKTLIGDLKTDSDNVFGKLNTNESPIPNFRNSGRGIQLNKKAVVTTSGLTPSFKINGTTFTLDSHSEGGVGAFSNSYMNMEIPQIKRLSTLVHESRHSECKIPVSLVNDYKNILAKLSDLNQQTLQVEDDFSKGVLSETEKNTQILVLKNSNKDLFKQIKDFSSVVYEDKNPNGSKSYVMVDCGFDHVDCPVDHPNAGIQGMEGACDDNPVGAYGVGYKFLMAVAEDCPSCKAVEREQARIKAGDSLDRYIGNEFPDRIRPRGEGPFQMGFPKVNLNGI